MLGLWAIGLGGPRLRIPGIIGLVAGAIIIGSVTLAYNKTLMDDATVFPVMAFFDQEFGGEFQRTGFRG